MKDYGSAVTTGRLPRRASRPACSPEQRSRRVGGHRRPVGGDVAPDERIDRAVETFGLPRHVIEAALAYYVEYTDEIDAQIDANRDAAERAEIQWRRQHDLLARWRSSSTPTTPGSPPNGYAPPATT